jgi:hypothetical protein
MIQVKENQQNKKLSYAALQSVPINPNGECKFLLENQDITVLAL